MEIKVKSLEDNKNVLKTLSIEDTFNLINIAISTAKIEKLFTPYAQIRPSLHLILAGRVGSMKSSILNQICTKLKVFPNFNLTSATILGTIDKNTGELIPPAIWDCRHSILPIDEFYIDEYSKSQMMALRAMLIVLENMPITKRVGFRVNNIHEKDKGCTLEVKEGTININTRFVLIANTMQPLFRKQKLIEMTALKTRCLVIPYYPTIDELFKMMEKELSFEYKPYKVEKIVKVPKDIYEYIKNLCIQEKVSAEDIVRTIGDLCRVYAVIGKQPNLFITILKLKCYTHED